MRRSEVGYPADVYFDCVGKAQRLGEEIRKLKSGIRHWSAPDVVNAWARIRMLESLAAKLDAMVDRGVDQIRISDFAKFEAEANRRWSTETIRARNRRNAEIQIELNATDAAIKSATTREEIATVRAKLAALSAELSGRPAPTVAKPKAPADRVPLDAKFAPQKQLADYRLGK